MLPLKESEVRHKPRRPGTGRRLFPYRTIGQRRKPRPEGAEWCKKCDGYGAVASRNYYVDDTIETCPGCKGSGYYMPRARAAGQGPDTKRVQVLPVVLSVDLFDRPERLE